MAWFETRYDTVVTKWPNGQQKEFITRFWFMGNEKGLRPHGQYSTWHENGYLKEDGCYQQATKLGAWIKWSDDGGRTEEVTIINGEPHGTYIQWHPDRNIKTLGHYKYGQKHGLWTYRRPGSDMHNYRHYIDSAQFYYEDKLVVKLLRRLGDDIHQETSVFSDELQLWVEWKVGRREWMSDYLWFEIGKKIDGRKEGKWTRLNHRGEILFISYFRNDEPIRLD